MVKEKKGFVMVQYHIMSHLEFLMKSKMLMNLRKRKISLFFLNADPPIQVNAGK